MLDDLIDYLTSLTPARTLVLFVIAFSLGSVVLLAPNPGGPMLTAFGTAAVVLGYGLILVYCQSIVFIRLRPPVQNSPYILGFVLTLVAFSNIFLSDRIGGTNSDDDLLKGQVGGAILSTIVGLIMRQVIVIYDPEEEELSNIYNDLSEQIRDQTSDFSKAQKGFVKLIQEFVSTKESLFGQEEEAFKRYIKNLNNVSEALARFENEHAAHWDDISKQVAQSLGEINKQTSESITRGQEIWVEAQDSLKKFQQVVEQSLPILESQVNTLDTWSKQVGQSTDDATKNVDRFSLTVQTANTHLADLGQRLEVLGTEFQGFKDRFVDTLTEVSSGAKSVSQQTIHWMEETAKDLTAIDAILNEVAELVQTEMEKRYR